MLKLLLGCDNMNDKKKSLFVLFIMLLLLVVGVSYAYFEAVVHGTGNTNAEGSAHTASIQDLILTGTTEVVDTNMIPGETSTYSFTIENPNDFQVCFGIYFDNVVNTFINTSDLEVSMGGEVGLFPTTGDTSTIIGGFRAPANATTPYTLTITYKDVEGKDQTGDMGAIFSGIIKARATECGPGPSERSLAKLASLNSNYVFSNSDRCLKTDADGKIMYPNPQIYWEVSSDVIDLTMSDEETPIICAMEDDYGTSYYLRGLHTDNNVKFANSCWKIVRITGNGGYKLIYNGDVDGSGTCTTNSGTHNGFAGEVITLNGNKLYGNSYTKNGSTYTLNETSTIDWSANYSSVIGKYTCGDTNDSCSTLFVVVGYYNENQGYALRLDQSSNYASIGTGTFNTTAGYGSSNNINSASPALVGYMYNETYPVKMKNLGSNSTNYYYGSSFTYTEGASRPYTLNDTVQIDNISDYSKESLIYTYHYTCFYGDDNTCDKLYFIYDSTAQMHVYYIELDGNETGPEALNKMLSNNLSTAKDSHVKGAIDWWYEQKLKNTVYESYLDDTVFCNDRTIAEYGGWRENGGQELFFNAGLDNYYLKCPQKKDAFTKNDTVYGNGDLEYPVGLLTVAESSLLGNFTVQKTGEAYWLSSPSQFTNTPARVMAVSDGDWTVYTRVEEIMGIRPAISLKANTVFVSGDGSSTNPFILE